MKSNKQTQPVPRPPSFESRDEHIARVGLNARGHVNGCLCGRCASVPEPTSPPRWKQRPEATIKFRVGVRSNRDDPNMISLADRAHQAMLAALETFAKENGCEAFIPTKSLVEFRYKEGKR